MATFVLDADLVTHYAAETGEVSSALQSRITSTLIPRANVAAYRMIRAKLLERGFTSDQIDEWDEGEDWNIWLAMCRLQPTGLTDDAASGWREKFCRADELETIPIMVDGEIVTPDSTAGGAIGYGDMERADDLFTRETTW